MKHPILLGGAALLSLTTLASALPAQTPAPDAAASAKPVPRTYGTWGVDLSVRDLSARPGDDFTRYAFGKWTDATVIPPDQNSTGTGYDIFNQTQDQLKALVTKAPPTSQLGALYGSFVDEAKVETVGDAPLKRDLAAVAAVPDKSAMARFMGSTQSSFGISPIAAEPYADPDTPTLNSLWLGQAGLGLPDRDYYLKDDFKPQRDAYQAYVARAMQMAGNPDPAGAAAKIMALETRIAQASWPAADRRDLTKIDNPMSGAELAAYAPGFDWSAWFAGAGIPPQGRIIVNENSAVKDIAAIVGETPLDTLKLWEQFHIVDQASPYLPKAYVDSRFAFSKTLSGVSELRPRWKRALDFIDGSLGELVGQQYVEAYFPPAAKAKMQELVGNLKLAMADRIRSNGWMAPETKQAALDKLARMDVMVGYPDTFRDYAKLTLSPTDLYGNVERSTAFEYAYKMEDLGKPVDRKKWSMTPQTVDAYNGGLENKIVFPAGILQAPMFNLAADDAVNYGGIGAVIGHEITHGFDDQGRKIDASGALRDWWTAGDAERYDAQAKKFGAQYATYEAAPGTFINPELTMGENLADFAGLEIALDAYHKSLGGKPAPVIDGLTGDQRFFLAFAQVWRGKQREDAIKQQVASDPHSPRKWRVIGPLRNMDAWYDAFGIGPDSKYYIAPKERVRIW
ncbi:MAG: M13 family metallopeptidase [Novosphingobium sp.]|nr:M13 family metallopeptidase [Novosphingobium sp.]